MARVPAARLGQGQLEPVGEQLAVRQAGEGIVERHVADGLLERPTLGDVDEDAVVEAHDARGVEDSPAVVAHPDGGAVAAGQLELGGLEALELKRRQVLATIALVHIQAADIDPSQHPDRDSRACPR